MGKGYGKGVMSEGVVHLGGCTNQRSFLHHLKRYFVRKLGNFTNYVSAQPKGSTSRKFVLSSGSTASPTGSPECPCWPGWMIFRYLACVKTEICRINGIFRDKSSLRNLVT
jgi:hypothetical protein